MIVPYWRRLGPGSLWTHLLSYITLLLDIRWKSSHVNYCSLVSSSICLLFFSLLSPVKPPDCQVWIFRRRQSPGFPPVTQAPAQRTETVNSRHHLYHLRQTVSSAKFMTCWIQPEYYY